MRSELRQLPLLGTEIEKSQIWIEQSLAKQSATLSEALNKHVAELRFKINGFCYHQSANVVYVLSLLQREINDGSNTLLGVFPGREIHAVRRGVELVFGIACLRVEDDFD
jgi:hypothetical protein